MNDLIIYLFILIANVISVLLIYHSFDKNMEKNKRLFYAMISMGIIYIILLIIYFFSSIGLEKSIAQESKEMITFTFVPVNSIILIPFLIRSFRQRKNNDITTEQLNRRATIMLIIAIILFVGEFFYFRKIEKGIINIYNQKQNNTIDIQQAGDTEETVYNEETTDDIQGNSVNVNEVTTNNKQVDNINNEENNTIQTTITNMENTNNDVNVVTNYNSNNVEEE